MFWMESVLDFIGKFAAMTVSRKWNKADRTNQIACQLLAWQETDEKNKGNGIWSDNNYSSILMLIPVYENFTFKSEWI
jgi:hypothetical protein